MYGWKVFVSLLNSEHKMILMSRTQITYESFNNGYIYTSQGITTVTLVKWLLLVLLLLSLLLLLTVFQIDGILLAKLINACCPSNNWWTCFKLCQKSHTFKWLKIQIVLLAAVEAIGCSVVNIGAEDLMSGKNIWYLD
jgi:uncharacterized membrane protein YfcA